MLTKLVTTDDHKNIEDNIVNLVQQLKKGKYGYFFTPEQLNEYTRNVGKTFLEAGAQKAVTKNEWEGNTGSEYCDTVVDKQSITNTFEETFKKFEI